jgi:hypothetical protein
MGVRLQGQPGLLAGSLDHPIEAVPGKRETNTNADFGSCSFCSLRSARNSSPRMGCLGDLPRFLRSTRISAAAKSMSDHSSSIISEARRPWRKATRIMVASR